jgi:molybdate transport system substrate-binding protein
MEQVRWPCSRRLALAGSGTPASEFVMTLSKPLRAISLILLFTHDSGAAATEIKVLSSVALKSALEELAPRYERSTGDKLAVSFDVAAALKNRIATGEPFDVAILTPAAIDGLVKDAKIDGASRADIARSGVGLAVHSGEAKPDIGSIEAFKGSMLSAFSIVYSKDGASGVYFAGLLDRLGIADAMRTRLTAVSGPSPLGLVVEGKAQLGVQLTSEILATPGVDLVGPLPADIQNYTVLTAALGQTALAPEAGKLFIRYLKGSEASAILRRKGLEPL